MPPITSVSPDWYLLGVNPNNGPAPFDFLIRCGSSTAVLRQSARRQQRPNLLRTRRFCMHCPESVVLAQKPIRSRSVRRRRRPPRGGTPPGSLAIPRWRRCRPRNGQPVGRLVCRRQGELTLGVLSNHAGHRAIAEDAGARLTPGHLAQATRGEGHLNLFGSLV
jgi:hypothetical protein